jgi:hypothetical protein
MWLMRSIEMKLVRTLSVVLLLAGVAVAAPTCLARVETQAGSAMAALGVPVVAERDGYCLVRVDDAGLAQLAAAAYQFTVLDRAAEQRLYVYVNTRGSFDRSRLAGFGDVLTEDRGGVVLATTEEMIGGLNRLPVELARIPVEPLTYGPDQPAPDSPVVDDSLVQLLVDRVSPDSILSSIRRLQNFYTRYSTTDSCRNAVAWVRDQFVAYGCDSTALENYYSGYAPNVLGVKRGTVNARPIYVICGHADNTSDYEPNRCPGSDDNASGTTAVIEACRVFSDIGFDNTVYFIGFTGEEQGLVGSDSFCRRAARRGDSVKAALNFDMISYGRQTMDTFEVIGKISNPNCAWLVDSFIANAAAYTSLKTKRSMVTSAPYSDHDRFWARGWPAFCGIEYDFTPEYHYIGDTIGPPFYLNCGTNNIPMATEAIKAAVATIAKLAGAHVTTALDEAGRPAPPARILRVLPSIGRAPVTVELTPARSAGARLVIYDAAGKLVRSLPAGNPTVSWDGRDGSGGRASAGIYLLRLGGSESAATARVVLTE